MGNDSSTATPSFEIKDGNKKIMFSAPHCVEQTRDGRIKSAEGKTGELVRLLNAEADCPVIYKTENRDDDANYDSVSPYKDALCEYVKAHGITMLVDLHELSPARRTLVDVGTGRGKNIKEGEITEFFRNSFCKYPKNSVKIDLPFAGANPRTVSSHIAAECGISCIQLEINCKLLYPSFKEYDFDGILNSLKTIAERFG